MDIEKIKTVLEVIICGLNMDGRTESVKAIRSTVEFIESQQQEIERLNADKWISIEDDKPRHLQRVQVSFVNKYDKKCITVGQYVKPKTELFEDYLDESYTDIDWGEYDEDKDCHWTPEGFYENQYMTDVNWFIDQKVTHWQPLPDVPRGER